MDTITIIVILALISIVLIVILYPLWQQTRPETVVQLDRSGQTLEEYQARYQASLAAIKDLMFDREMGKVSTEDYETLLTKTKIEAAKIRREIDLLSESSVSHDAETALDAEIETLIAQLRQDQTMEKEPLLREVDAEIEILKKARFDTAGTAGLACPNCGKTIQLGDAFCSGCGQSAAGLEPEADTCPQCGHAFQPDDAFCVKCGTALPSSNENIKIHSPEDAKI